MPPEPESRVFLLGKEKSCCSFCSFSSQHGFCLLQATPTLLTKARYLSGALKRIRERQLYAGFPSFRVRSRASFSYTLTRRKAAIHLSATRNRCPQHYTHVANKRLHNSSRVSGRSRKSERAVEAKNTRMFDFGRESMPDAKKRLFPIVLRTSRFIMSRHCVRSRCKGNQRGKPAAWYGRTKNKQRVDSEVALRDCAVFVFSSFASQGMEFRIRCVEGTSYRGLH